MDKPSVTQILKKLFPMKPEKAIELALSCLKPGATAKHIDFAAVAPFYFSKLAADAGRDVHTWFFDLITYKEPVLLTKGLRAQACYSLKAWHKTYPLGQYVRIEPKLEGLHYTGTPDIVDYPHDAEEAVYDLKLANEPNLLSWRYQLSAYADLLGGGMDRHIIWVNKKEKQMPVTLITFPQHELERDIAAWHALVHTYYHITELEEQDERDRTVNADH